jgi:hypothetical protein
MILTTHALSGAVIGKNVGNPYLVILLSIIVHFAMDQLRHGEYVEVFSKNTSIKNSGWKVLLDFSTGAILIGTFLFFSSDNLNIFNVLLGSFFSILPDFITALYWKFRWKILEKYYKFHSGIHKYSRFAPEREWTFRNARNDILISFIAIILLLFL